MSGNSFSSNSHQDRPTLGIAALIGNLVLMALISVAVRELSSELPLAEILLFRFIAATVFFWIILLSTSHVASLATRRPVDHFIRGCSGVVSLSLFFYALTLIPIADATALAYAAPIFITVMSIFLLGEKIGVQRWVAILVGFVGVLLIAQPGAEEINIGVIAAIGSAVAGAMVAIWLRKLSSSEQSVTIGIYYNSLGTLVCVIWVLSTNWVTPSADSLPLLIAFGLMCGFQQWWLTISFRYAEASLLAPFEYLAMVFAAIVGFLFWQEIPRLTTWIGAAVIAFSGLFIFMRRKKSSGAVAASIE